MRYRAEIDTDRQTGGWGRHCWVIDTQTGKSLCLLPETEALVEVDRLNALEPHSSDFSSSRPH